MRTFKLTLFVFLLVFQSAFAQKTYDSLLREMEQFEADVVETYRSYLWLFYEEKQSSSELLAFEDLLGIYIVKLRQAYETMALLGQHNLEVPRDIAARSLIFRALTFLEKAPIDVTYFEKACYDYYEALTLYESTEKVPVIFKNLPYSIRLGNKYYNRLIDLLDEKGKDLFQFGQVQLVLKNFKVTSPFDENALELVKFNEADSAVYTYALAENRLREAFRTALQSNRTESISLALPAGVYFIRSQQAARSDYRNLATVYVRPNQYITYLVEPIADWVIFYEVPAGYLDGDELSQASPILAETTALFQDSTASDSLASYAKSTPAPVNGAMAESFHSVDKISLIVERLLNQAPQANLDALPINRDREAFIRGMAQIISTRISGEYLNSWNLWTQSWNIAKKVTERFAANRTVSTATIELTYAVVSQL